MQISWHQPDLLDATPTDAEIAHLRAHLGRYGWQTRRQISAVLGWTERHVREVAELMGADIVRSHAGFKLTADLLTVEDRARAFQAVAAALSQSAKMRTYAETLRARLEASKP